MDIVEIENPKFLENLNDKELKNLAKEMRIFLIESISQTGGHLSSNLGVVELSIALHKVFNNPDDRIFFDVGHQSYIHKILTGRAALFPTLRQYKGLSGFQKRNESPYDYLEAGHSSTTISAAVGMAIARDLDNDDYNVVPVIGDGALMGGMAIEALNHLGHIQKKVVVIFNDNDMSISKNVGGINTFLDKVRISMPYLKAKHNYKEIMHRSTVGKITYKTSSLIKAKIKSKVISNMFMDMGLDYIGPLDGHDFHDLLRGLNKAKNSTGPIVVHVMTKKGKGYKPAENDESGKWHGVSQFDPKTGETISHNNNQEKLIPWSKVIANAVEQCMETNKDIVTITPAMIGGSKLESIFKNYPDRAFDVGIAEQHATMMAAGLGLSGKHPFLSIYSTFSQRSYDQFNHDLARMDLPCLIGIDRAGLVGEDGETHHGIFDISLYRNLPNFIVTAPRDNVEATALVKEAFNTNHPFVIRYPRGNTVINKNRIVNTRIGCWETLVESDENCIITYGNHSSEFLKIIEKENYKCGLVHAKYIKPIDKELFVKIILEKKKVLVFEPDIKGGGFASSLLEFANEISLDVKDIEILSISDKYVEAGSIPQLMKGENLDYSSVIKNFIGNMEDCSNA
ncbi:1-deoxy-D-xylulose-5-phosphate synthase [Mycoplasma sp. P36-A1]|uniref:1-deoxy-D-xylulose-5-phosphate synthase n=1 Tax=Mycoplasma sp. P36-A1 TaxID=3252900 RepID=UPI003C2EB0BD